MALWKSTAVNLVRNLSKTCIKLMRGGHGHKTVTIILTGKNFILFVWYSVWNGVLTQPTLADENEPYFKIKQRFKNLIKNILFDFSDCKSDKGNKAVLSKNINAKVGHRKGYDCMNLEQLSLITIYLSIKEDSNFVKIFS